jgi:hypothetical protein
MADDVPIFWELCSHERCIGARVGRFAWCLAHLAEQEPQVFEEVLRGIGSAGIIDVRGVKLEAELLTRILDSAPHDGDFLVLREARFDQAIIPDVASFGGATFQGDASFGDATFQGTAGFGGATFKRGAWFHRTAFEGGAWFNAASFQGSAIFDEATFGRTAEFYEVTFSREAEFNGATFQNAARFSGATFRARARFAQASFRHLAAFDDTTFQGDCHFSMAAFEREVAFGKATFHRSAAFAGSTFLRPALFARTTFLGEAEFGGTGFRREARFDSAVFERARRLGPLVARQLVLDDAIFGERVQVFAATPALCARRAQFPAGVQFQLRWASVALDDANLAAPSILAAAPPAFGVSGENEAARGWQRLPPGPRSERWRPRLLSLCRADVAGLRIANTDVRPCRFAGAHNLDRLRIEGSPLFARTSGWWRVRRNTLAEEQQWRAGRIGRWRPHRWYPRTCQPPESRWVEQPPVLAPVQIAALYRELRKGREDAKDEPGAADFYYGEMEMRRHNADAPRAERFVLWLYWLVSGYALRAWRALAALSVVVVLAAVVFAVWGFPRSEPRFGAVRVDRTGALVYEQRPADPPPGIERLPAAIRFSARSATALLRGPDRALTPVGEWLEIMLRFLGPVLLGLAVLSIRGRVRR